MGKIMSSKIKLLVCLLFVLTFTEVDAQWGAPYSNKWISYDKPYIKIGVSSEGIYKLALELLPKNFPVDKLDKLQLWHRGKQVSILRVTNKEILFYGVPNDGASDSLLYRPMSSRMNPYWSMYSDRSAYFLTIGEQSGLRSETVNKTLDSTIPLLPYHTGSILNTYKNEYSLSTSTYLRPDFFNSFFEIGASRTGKVSMDGKATNYSFQLVNLVPKASDKMQVELLIHGRSGGSRNVEIRVGKTNETLRIVGSPKSSGFEGLKYSFELTSDDLDVSGKGIISLKSVSSSQVDGYSLAYYKISYPQSFDMKGKKTSKFILAPSLNSVSRLSIGSVPDSSIILDISDKDSPKLISGDPSDLIISRELKKETSILVSNESVSVKKEDVTEIDNFIQPAIESNYIIVTSQKMLESVNQYADYRRSAKGGSFKVLIATIEDIYNQFNYGEPSPLAIRRFADFVLSDHSKDKYLYLIGKSITYNERMVRELPDEVPTIGFPGSDILLVEGLAGFPRDVPAMQIGRLPAITNQNVLDYLQKVQEYENVTSDNYSFKKNFLHLNGGKSAGEITQLKNLLSSLEPVVQEGTVGGKVTPFVKQQGIAEVESVNITSEVNSGTGMITYFGHGSTTVTDLNMGYATDVDRGYNNSGKYPFMYFNGCGVGNIFSARFNPNPGASDRYPLSVDWILARKRGAIAIVANSFESFVSPSSNYLNKLYAYMFADSLTNKLSIGKIQKALAQKIVTESPDKYSVANVHQSLLQGDPALKLISFAAADYAINPIEGIKIYSEAAEKVIESSPNLRVELYLENKGQFIKDQEIPLKITYTYEDGTINVTNKAFSSFSYLDTLTFTVANSKRLQRMEVVLDPENKFSELSKSNNFSDLIIDWEIAKKQNSYPQGTVNDLIAPLLTVKFNNRLIKNEETLEPSPTIKFILEDDRFLVADTSHLSIYLKDQNKEGSDFDLVPYDNEVNISKVSNRVIEVEMKTSMLIKDGTYELLAVARDEIGNVANPYRIVFSIKETSDEEPIMVVASPNPASSYVRFEVTGSRANQIESFDWVVYDLYGREIEKNNKIMSNEQTKEKYWLSTSIPAGSYFYKVSLKYKNTVKDFTGKVVIVK